MCFKHLAHIHVNKSINLFVFLKCLLSTNKPVHLYPGNTPPSALSTPVSHINDFQIITHTHTLSITTSQSVLGGWTLSESLRSAFVLAVCECSPVDPAQRVIRLLVHMRVPPFRLLHLPLGIRTSGHEKHPSQEHQGKGDPS